MRIIHAVPDRVLARARRALPALAIILLASAIRVGLIAAGWPGTDSDDSTMGLIALHILTHGERPIFFYGQAYMGTIEAYLGALMFAIFGVSLFALKLGLVLLYAAFMAVMYLLLAGLFTRRWALAGLLLLSLGADAMLFQQLNAYGGYLETIFFGALMITLALWLARGSRPFDTSRARLAGFAAWGLAAGLGIWSDPLVSPFVALTALLIGVFAGREARGRAGGIALLALLIGVSPWFVYIVSARAPSAAASFLQRVPQVTSAPGVASRAPAPSPLQIVALHIEGAIVVAVPNETGASALCSISQNALWPPSQWSAASAPCLAARGLWGASYLGLLALACAIEAQTLRGLWRAGRAAWKPEQRRAAAISASRLAALLAPAGTVALFTLSSASATAPAIYDRYLISFLIATPVMLGSLWARAASSAARVWPRPFHATAPRALPWSRLAVGTVYAGLLATLLAGVAGAWRLTAAQPAFFRVQNDLIQRLIAGGDTRVYSEFWTCYRMIFLSDERVVCSVLNADLTHRPSRYAPYDALVAATTNPAYVFPLRTSQAVNFERAARQHGWRVSVTIVDGVYGIYHVEQFTPGATSPPAAQPATP